jgi:predicted nucleotidyltransferase
MRREEAIQRLRANTDRLSEAGIRVLYLFGSTARDQAGKDSDIDLFVDPDYDRLGFVELIRTEAFLFESLGRRVELTTRDGLHPLLRSDIEREAIRVI